MPMEGISYKPLIRDMVWSYSRVKAFDDCPYRWYLKYIRYPQSRRKEMFFSGYGKFMHELLAKFYRGEQTARDLELEYLINFGSKVQAPAPNERIFKRYFTDGINCIRCLTQPRNKVIAVEEEVKFQIGEIKMVGYVDRIEEDQGGRLIIVDSKSRELKNRSNRNKPTKADHELDQYLTQLYLYSIPVRQRFGSFPGSLCLDCFRNQTLIQEKFDDGALNRSIKWAQDLVEKISSETEFRPDISYFKCRYLCEMQDRCEYFELSTG